ncbi:hypothetical protein Pelo_13796 [Pelomyxa schiedti]|nr:hypothetical protein Pelo_13796 [Pelomyxa schiedti]
MVCVDLKTSFESHNLAVTQEFLGLSFTVEEVFHSKKHKVIAATWGCNTRGDRAWNLRSLQQQPPHHPVLLHTSEDHLPDNLAKVDNTHFAATFLFGGSPLGAEQLKDSSCRFCEFAGSHDNRRPLFDIFAFVPCKEQESLPGSRLSTPIDKLLLCSRLPLVGSKLGSHDNYLM